MAMPPKNSLLLRLTSGGQTTRAAAEAIEALCNDLSGEFFSESGFDTFMASRFGGRLLIWHRVVAEECLKQALHNGA